MGASNFGGASFIATANSVVNRPKTGGYGRKSKQKRDDEGCCQCHKPEPKASFWRKLWEAIKA